MSAKINTYKYNFKVGNKIIHGDQFSIQSEDTSQSYENIASSSTIFISGFSANGKPWIARLDIIKFVKACQKALVSLETAFYAES
ncbi:MAG: hypothetical protein R1F54_04990 [Candidatus Zeuxoniibacter abyssi]|nr:MAG: hypothetical protein R1F54_04990 [Candidatus Persebacteraceae bacterium AB1(2)]